MAKATQELKYKRLKVGHACYVCRSKKIKCDGLRPCMQCKARGRNCQPSSSDTVHTPTEQGSENGQDESKNNSISPDDESILFSKPKTSAIATKRLKDMDTWTHNAGQFCSENYRKNQKLGEYPIFGRFVRWRHEPPLPSTYSVPIEMPPIEMQMHLIHQFFETKYMISPVIPKRLFYEQLRIKGPLITPLLLNAIYCISSSFGTMKNAPKPVVFFNRAIKLLDDFLDTPRVSTVAALYLLASFETHPATEQHCRSWVYNGMACRMCLELGLNMDSAQSRQDMSEEGIELRRRVFWSCYCLDKLQAAERERLWALPSSLTTTALPNSLPGDDEHDKWVLFIFQLKIKIGLIGEEGLQIRASYAIREDITEEQFHAQLIGYYNKLVQWRENLPTPELWNFKHCETIEEVFSERKKPQHVGYLLVIYYFMLCDTLSCLPYDPNMALEHRICAALLIRHVEDLCNDSHAVLRYEFLGHIIIAAIRVHAMYLDSPDPVIARQSWELYNQCVRVLEKLGILAMIPECASVLQHIATVSQQARAERQQQQQQQQETAGNLSTQTQNLDDVAPPFAFKDHNPQYAGEYNLRLEQQQTIAQFRTHQGYEEPYRGSSQADQSFPNLIGSSLQRAIVAFGESFGMIRTDQQDNWNYGMENPQQQQQTSEESISQHMGTSSGNRSEWQGSRAHNLVTHNAASEYQQQQQQQQSSQPQLPSHLPKTQLPLRSVQQTQSEQLQQQQPTAPQQFHGQLPISYAASPTSIVPPIPYPPSVTNVIDNNGIVTYVPQISSTHNVQQNLSNATLSRADNLDPNHNNNNTANNNNIRNPPICCSSLPTHIDNIQQHTFYSN
ncbi:fungal-specific transcription factor domain-containing protein [Mycotypha africana]|uniref:fungal-specific transcription factor domain-containing protein n=1 Tax=Mycotypha africana TaxID=64632 RepID=UPI002301BD83|nr:fungal-specific transcription factor domain-containing protein [Mycotypha africana]KAI8991705.1 fungal-specific transcription factor domain-containing protein [Mycotypha africana]